MSQTTDSADLFGGFKPVDSKFLLKPVYDTFMSVFLSIMPREKNKQFLDLMTKSYKRSNIKDFVKCMNHGLKALADKSKSSEIEGLSSL